MKFYVSYEDRRGDLCNVWVNADSKEDAIRQVKHEYWDVSEILSVHR